YGYRTNGIYETSAEARADNYTSVYNSKYKAGDIRFVDRHADGIINEQDKQLLGSTSPDCFGSLFTQLRFRQISLNAQFNYRIGGKIYNAVRRQLESMDNFHNQSVAVLNRWQAEGQETTMPRAVYGDPSGNNVFSDRWIEDGSYIKLGSLSLSYSIDQPIGKLFRSGTVWISGENLLTFTNYLGNDPELAYNYDEALYGMDFAKVANPITLKIGFNLNF
ncbi:MAG TPA: SusC/RagA family protein, partial [Bacteroidales bacterium]|nr:SusC/RagA family protein [Bacteroidales bacterium]